MKKLCFSYTSLIILIFVILFQPSQATFMALRPSDLVLFLIYICQILRGFPRLKITQFKFLENFGIYYAIIISISLLSLVYFSYQNVTADTLFHIYHFLRFYFLFIIVSKIVMYDDRFGPILIKGYLFIIILVILTAFTQYFQINPFSQYINDLYIEDKQLDIYIDYYDIRVTGVIGNTNGLAIIMASIAPIILNKLFQKDQNNFIVIALYLVFFLVFAISVTFLTSSRTSIIAILVCFFFLLFTSIKTNPPLKTISFLVLFTLVLLLIITTPSFERFVPERVHLFFEGIFQDTRGETKLLPRILIWEEKNRIFNHIKYPLKYIFGISYTNKDLAWADNGILTSYFNAGINGVALRLLLYYYIIMLLFKSTKLNLHHQNVQTNQVYLSALIIFLLLIFDFTSEAIEYYKIAQVLYIFLAVTVVKYNILISQKKQ